MEVKWQELSGCMDFKKEISLKKRENRDVAKFFAFNKSIVNDYYIRLLQTLYSIQTKL